MGSWRELVDQALSTEDNRDVRDNSPEKAPIVSIVPNVSPPLSSLRDWCATVAALDPVAPVKGIERSRWARLVETSEWFLLHYGRQAARDGWQTGDLFGLHPKIEGAGGLVDRLGNSRNLILEGHRARWRDVGGIARRFNAGAYPELSAFWEDC